jgi:zinc transporter, ZIP family
MLRALGLGTLAQISLLLSGILAYTVRVPTKVVGFLAGFGGGALISSIAFDLVDEAQGLDDWELVAWMLSGAAVFLVGDRIVEKRFGDEGAGQAMGIVVGSVVDGVPESVIFGIQIAAGVPVSASFLIAVMVSNVPQALAPSADLKDDGWSMGRTTRLWAFVVAACGVAAGLGYLLSEATGTDGAGFAALAAGGLLAMLTDSLLPFAYERGGEIAGVGTVLGFCFALATS